MTTAPHGTAPGSPARGSARTTVVLDVTDDAALAASVDTLDAALRARIADALRRAASRDNDAALLRALRAELAELHPEATPVGVVFTTDTYDEGWFFDHISVRVLFTDGEEETVAFGETVRSLLTDEYGRRGPSCSLAVDLRTGEFTDDDEHDPRRTLAEHFGLPPHGVRT